MGKKRESITYQNMIFAAPPPAIGRSGGRILEPPPCPEDVPMCGPCPFEALEEYDVEPRCPWPFEAEEEDGVSP